MTDHERSPEPTNGLPTGNGFAAHEQSEEPKDKKKNKKQKKKEEKKRREFLERFPAAPPQFDATHPAQLAPQALALPMSSSRSLQGWLRPASRNLNNSQIVAAQKSSALIAINCLMLSIAALSVYRELGAGRLWLALIPLALTNGLSLAFAILSAQVQQNTTLDELCSLPEEEYEPALTAIIQNKEHLYLSLRRDVRALGTDLGHRQKHLRTAYNVLLGGIPLSIFVFGVCVAVASRS